MKRRILMLALAFAAAAASSARADDTVPFVVVVDDGSIEGTRFDTNEHANTIVNALLSLYDGSGAPLPEVMSIWTAFPFDDNTIETRFVPIGNDVTGIGLENAFGAGQETFNQLPPLRAMLIHNDVTVLPDRAAFQGLPAEGFGDYLFLLELGHMFGPEIHLAGAPADRLIGFDFHWSFFVDAGGSPIGGNAWTDNGDGTFTAPPFDPSAVTYSPLDLYLMGLAPASDVPPFGLLHDVTVPADAIDPFTGRGIGAASFPWQGPDPLTVTATREALTIDDVIAQNGARAPAFGTAPTSFTLGIVLVVPQALAGEDLAAVERDFAPFAASLAPSFARATGERGSLSVVTSSPAPPPAPVVTPPPDEQPPKKRAPPAARGCAASGDGGVPAGVAAGVLAFAAWRRRRVGTGRRSR